MKFYSPLTFSNEKNKLFLHVNIEGFNFSQPFKVKWDLPFKFDPCMRYTYTKGMYYPGEIVDLLYFVFKDAVSLGYNSSNNYERYNNSSFEFQKLGNVSQLCDSLSDFKSQ